MLLYFKNNKKCYYTLKTIKEVKMRLKNWYFFIFFVVILFLWYGCTTTKMAKCTLAEDNPEHHYIIGMKALEEANHDLAIEKFERALYCNENFSKAYSGLSIAKAEKTKSIKDSEFRQVEFERIKNILKDAKKKANTPEEEFEYYLAQIRVYTALKPKNWLSFAEKAYFNAEGLNINESKLSYYQEKEAIHYFMGVAYFDSFDFEKAKDEFRKVLNTKKEGKWHALADKAWKKTDKIIRAMAGLTVGNVGKKIAIQDSITRADFAALLVDELRIDRLFAGRVPLQSQIEKLQPEFTPADILSHPFKKEILTILKWKIRGFEPKYDETTKSYLFKPEDVVSRGEMALILEDVLIKLTGDEKIATAYFGHERSPFVDVKPTSPFYNAVMNMITRGIMEAELSGEFNPEKAVTGADAILAIRLIKQQINIY